MLLLYCCKYAECKLFLPSYFIASMGAFQIPVHNLPTHVNILHHGDNQEPSETEKECSFFPGAYFF